MTERVATVEIADYDGGTVVFRLSGSEVMDPEALRFRPLKLDMAKLPPLDCREAVATYGSRLSKALSLHDRVKAELGQIFGTTAPNRASLRLEIATPAGELLRWETLCKGPKTFLALNSLCSLRRIAYVGTARDTGLRIYAKPLRMVAFLSPIGIGAAGELGAIVKAVEKARLDGLGIEATIYLGEQDLLDETAARVEAGELPGIIVRPMPDEPWLIEAALKEQPYQFIHFFCHGVSELSNQLLEFASINDNDIGAEIGSVNLWIERVRDALASTGTAWVTVLNSCSGARAAPDLYSMARSIAERASPVAIGMAEPISDADATLITESFYGDAFRLVGEALQGLTVGNATVIDFGPAVWAARTRLHDTYLTEPGSFGRWCLPILYERDSPLRVAPIDTAMKARIDGVAAALRGLPVGSPGELRDGILALLDKDPKVPENLRPDMFGNLK